MSTPTATVLLHVGTCVVDDCHARVEVHTTRNGGLAVIDAHGYSGLTDAGELACPDHFCPDCGDYHATVEAYQRCHTGNAYDTPRCGLDCTLGSSAR